MNLSQGCTRYLGLISAQGERQLGKRARHLGRSLPPETRTGGAIVTAEGATSAVEFYDLVLALSIVWWRSCVDVEAKASRGPVDVFGPTRTLVFVSGSGY